MILIMILKMTLHPFLHDKLSTLKFQLLELLRKRLKKIPFTVAAVRKYCTLSDKHVNKLHIKLQYRNKQVSGLSNLIIWKKMSKK